VHQQLLARSTDATQRAIAAASERIASFEYTGRGHVTAAEEFLAHSGRVRERERRRIAWEERFSGVIEGRVGGRVMSEGDSIRALATVTLDVRSLDADSIERLAELVESRIAGRREWPADRLLSVDDVAELSGLSRSLVYREIERGHLPAYKVGARLRIEPAAVARWKERCQVRPRSLPPVYEPVTRPRRGSASSSFVAELDMIERDAGRAA
jgi:excisionase family DNA binding protein